MQTIAYGTHPAQCLDLYLPDTSDFPVFVYFHGGGLEEGDKADSRVVFDFLRANGVAVISANYRMYPTAAYPDFLEDAAAVVAWAFHHMGAYGRVQGIYVGGSSAGGYLSQMLCFDNRWLAAHQIDPTDLSGFVLDAGQPTCHFNILRERGVDTRRVMIDESAALYHVGEQPRYAPMLILVSDNDMQNRYEQTELLVSTLRHFGHEKQVHLKVMHGTHCAYVNAVDGDGTSVFGRLVLQFIREGTV